MPVKSAKELFIHELGDIYDAEHQFLEAQKEMRQQTSDDTLKEMITTHMEETEQQISVLEEVFQAIGEEPKREPCAGAKGLVNEGKKMMEETKGAPRVRDVAISGSAEKVEHYEIVAYTGLIRGAEMMGQREAVSLLQRNLEQELSTARLLEQNSPALLENAASDRDMRGSTGSQASPSH